MVDSDLERQRVWSVEQRDAVQRSNRSAARGEADIPIWDGYDGNADIYLGCGADGDLVLPMGKQQHGYKW